MENFKTKEAYMCPELFVILLESKQVLSGGAYCNIPSGQGTPCMRYPEVESCQ